MKREIKEKLKILAKQVERNEITDIDLINLLRNLANKIEEEK